MIEGQAQGLAFVCDSQGLILRVLRNDLELEKAAPGQLFFGLVESASRMKALNFLTEVKAQEAVLDWEMNIPSRGTILTLHFAGGVACEALLITAATDGPLATRLYKDMLRINNEQTNQIRSMVEKSVRISDAPSDEMYNEISHLNNELVAMQRELAKKNAELERLQAELKKLAITDALTGLYNRRGFFEKGNFELERTKRYRHPLAAIMIDLDHFKKINDTYGHAVGDLVLKETAARLTKQIRTVDIFGRYGGEEFSLYLLPDTGLEQAKLVAERLRQNASLPIVSDELIVNITISLGLAIFDAAIPDVQGLLQRADQALYQAKKSGRNRVCVDQENSK